MSFGCEAGRIDSPFARRGTGPELIATRNPQILSALLRKFGLAPSLGSIAGGLGGLFGSK